MLDIHIPRVSLESPMAFDIQAHRLSLCVAIALVSSYAVRIISNYRTGRLPPGPKGIPFLGNLFQLSLMPWKQFGVWKKQYGTFTPHSSSPPKLISVLNAGPLVYLTVGGQGILVLNTHQVAADLLDRRGHIYSDRPRLISKHGCCRRNSASHCYTTFSSQRDTMQWAEYDFAQLRRHVRALPFS